MPQHTVHIHLFLNFFTSHQSIKTVRWGILIRWIACFICSYNLFCFVSESQYKTIQLSKLQTSILEGGVFFTPNAVRMTNYARLEHVEWDCGWLILQGSPCFHSWAWDALWLVCLASLHSWGSSVRSVTLQNMQCKVGPGMPVNACLHIGILATIINGIVWKVKGWFLQFQNYVIKMVIFNLM